MEPVVSVEEDLLLAPQHRYFVLDRPIYRPRKADALRDFVYRCKYDLPKSPSAAAGAAIGGSRQHASTTATTTTNTANITTTTATATTTANDAKTATADNSHAHSTKEEKAKADEVDEQAIAARIEELREQKHGLFKLFKQIISKRQQNTATIISQPSASIISQPKREKEEDEDAKTPTLPHQSPVKRPRVSVSPTLSLIDVPALPLRTSTNTSMRQPQSPMASTARYSRTSIDSSVSTRDYPSYHSHPPQHLLARDRDTSHRDEPPPPPPPLRNRPYPPARTSAIPSSYYYSNSHSGRDNRPVIMDRDRDMLPPSRPSSRGEYPSMPPSRAHDYPPPPAHHGMHAHRRYPPGPPPPAHHHHPHSHAGQARGGRYAGPPPPPHHHHHPSHGGPPPRMSYPPPPQQGPLQQGGKPYSRR